MAINGVKGSHSASYLQVCIDLDCNFSVYSGQQDAIGTVGANTDSGCFGVGIAVEGVVFQATYLAFDTFLAECLGYASESFSSGLFGCMVTGKVAR